MTLHDGEPPRVVLTGGTGFIGCHVQDALLDAGFRVTLVIRPGSLNRDAVRPECECLEAALSDEGSLETALEQATFAVYAAGTVRGGAPQAFAPANIAGVTSFARAAHAAMAHPRVVLISSLAASRPELSDYAYSKHAGEEALKAVNGLETVIVRPPAVYGPGDREMRPLFAAIRRGLAVLVGPPGQRLSLLYGPDLAGALVAILGDFERCAGQCFELDDGRPEGYGWQDIIASVTTGRVIRFRVPRPVLAAVARLNLIVARGLGYAPMLTPGKLRELCESRWLCNNRALTAATGWKPKYDLGRGVQETFRQPEHRAITRQSADGRS